MTWRRCSRPGPRSPARGSSSSRRSRLRLSRPALSRAVGLAPGADAPCARPPTRPSASASRSPRGPSLGCRPTPAVAAAVLLGRARSPTSTRRRRSSAALPPARALARAPGRPPDRDAFAARSRAREPGRLAACLGGLALALAFVLGYLSHGSSMPPTPGHPALLPGADARGLSRAASAAAGGRIAGRGCALRGLPRRSWRSSGPSTWSASPARSTCSPDRGRRDHRLPPVGGDARGVGGS